MRTGTRASAAAGPARRLGCVLAVAMAALLLGTGASASAAIPFCTFGSGPGQCKEPSGVAVDTTLGRVYVHDVRVNGGPSSLSFLGAGNVKEAAPKPRCRKGKTRHKGRCVPRKPSKRAKQASKNRRAGR